MSIDELLDPKSKQTLQIVTGDIQIIDKYYRLRLVKKEKIINNTCTLTSMALTFFGFPNSNKLLPSVTTIVKLFYYYKIDKAVSIETKAISIVANWCKSPLDNIILQQNVSESITKFKGL